MSHDIKKGDRIIIHTEENGDIHAKCTGVTHDNLIHFMYHTKNNCPIAGCVGSQWAEKDV